MKAKLDDVIDSVGAKLAEQDIPVHQITGHSGSRVTVVTSDVSPEHQMAVEEICREHQLGPGLHPGVPPRRHRHDSGPDTPQAERVQHHHQATPGMYRRLRAHAETMLGRPVRPDLEDSLMVWALFRGHLAGFWDEDAPRCCACQHPVTDTGGAFRDEHPDFRLHQHPECGDFPPGQQDMDDPRFGSPTQRILLEDDIRQLPENSQPLPWWKLSHDSRDAMTGLMSGSIRVQSKGLNSDGVQECLEDSLREHPGFGSMPEAAR